MLYTVDNLESSAEKRFYTNPSDAAGAAAVDLRQVRAIAVRFNATDAIRVATEELPDVDASDPAFDPSWTATAWQDADGAIHVRAAIPGWLVVRASQP
jgi:hypothetical protein